MIFVALACTWILSEAAVQYPSEALADQITRLPGTDGLDITFNQFSGYLTVGGRKHLHYWFVESMNSVENDPVAFWTNGGPGCSGLIGFLTEQGPFRPKADLSLTMNQFSWNSNANMVFIEAPAGVGFSYSDDPKDYETGDLQTATDNYELIQAFFDRFPMFRQNELHLSSESYGGHYIPTLAKKIVQENERNINTDRWLNFKGIAIGNPYTDRYSGTPAMIDTFWGHQLISHMSYQKYLESCDVETGDFSDDELVEFTADSRSMATKSECDVSIDQILQEAGSLNPYALDYRICNREHPFAKGVQQRIAFLNSQRRHHGRELNIDEYVPCTPQFAKSYLNLDSVKSALHVKSDIVWDECSKAVGQGYNKTDSRVVSTAPIYKELIEGTHKINILIFSGDDDGVCATIGTQKWIWNLGYSDSPRVMWAEYTFDNQMAGYYTTWDNTNFTFLTVHNAGHEVPAYRPDVALDLWKRYLRGGWW